MMVANDFLLRIAERLVANSGNRPDFVSELTGKK
jgi:hypothetical protein